MTSRKQQRETKSILAQEKNIDSDLSFQLRRGFLRGKLPSNTYINPWHSKLKLYFRFKLTETVSTATIGSGMRNFV